MGKLSIKICKSLCFFKKPFYGSFGFKSCIYKPILISGKKHIYIGNNVFFRNHARIECIDNWKGIKYNPLVKIGDNTSFEQNVHITSAGNLTIGKNCTILARAMITNITHDYTDIDKKILDNPIIVKDVKIGNNCFIGMDCKIFPGVNIGDGVIIGANSIVMHDLPSYTVCVGVPAKPIKKYNHNTKKWEKVDGE